MPSIVVLLAALYLAAAFVFLGRRKPGYNHVRHTLSELGEVGAPDQRLVAWGVFFPVGAAAAVVGFLLHPMSFAACALALCIAVRFIVGAALPCDPGPPVVGSTRQGLHNLALAVEYLGGGAALMSIDGPYGQYFRMAGFVPWVLAFVLMLAPASPVRGLFQRATELVLFGALAFAAHLLE